MTKRINSFLNSIKDNKLVRFLDQVIYRFTHEETMGGGAQMAFFLTLSLFPFMIALLNLIQFTKFVNRDMIISALAFLPEDVNKYLVPFISQIAIDSSQGLLSVAAIGGLWTASSGVNKLIKLIEKSYDEKSKRPYIIRRIISFIFTLALIVLIIVFFSGMILGSKIGIKLFEELRILKYYGTALRILRPIVLISYAVIVFTLFYWFSISKKNRMNVRLSEIIPGALFSTISVYASTKLFDLYISRFDKFSLYGSLGGVIILLFWLFILGIVIILGGQINATLTNLKMQDENGHKREYSFIEEFLSNDEWL
ncbi:MAG: YihY/virulence factor BrkB family protein [Tissierellia bacterium]|nr:YihY/virulence factor BrkB family protein [Tissierellia bacterium]